MGWGEAHTTPARRRWAMFQPRPGTEVSPEQYRLVGRSSWWTAVHGAAEGYWRNESGLHVNGDDLAFLADPEPTPEDRP